MAFPTSIISSDIIGNKEDKYWDELPEDLKEANEVTLLVISHPIEKGSIEDTQLQKMIQACQLEKNQYYILYIEQNMAWHKLKEVLKPKAVLLLGVMPEKLGISAMLRLFVPNSFDSCIWIPSLSLSDMEKQIDTKKQLWLQGLKPVFVDKIYGNL